MRLPLSTTAGIAAALAAGVFVAACGRGGSTAPQFPTPTPESTIQALPTALPTPMVTGSRVRSTAVGYEADIPAGWRLSPNVISSGSFRADAFFKPDASNGTDPTTSVNIAVGCEPLSESPGDLETELSAKLDVLKKLGRENIRTSDRAPVDGRPAKQIDYTQRLTVPTPSPGTPTTLPPELVFDRRQVFFTSASCRWSVELAAPAGMLEADGPVLEALVSSMKLIAS